MTRFLLSLATTIVLAVPALSQGLPVYEQTGAIEIAFGNGRMTHYTTRNTVPDQPGRQIHSASWITLEPRLIGGVNIMPDDIFVTVRSRGSVEPEPGQASLLLEFSLDPDTLELRTETPHNIRFYPPGGSSDGYYALTEGSLRLERTARTDGNGLAILGIARGVMTFQTSETIVHAAAGAVEFSARFDLANVGSRAAD